MAILIGTDEAGYGPNLGPLVVTATVWRIPDELADCDLYSPLPHLFAAEPLAEMPNLPLPIADSKLLYRPGGDLAALERGVLTLLQLSGVIVKSWRELWRTLDTDSFPDMNRLPWYVEFDCPLPADCSSKAIADTAAAAAPAVRESCIRCEAIRSRAVFPQRFNELIRHSGNKASALSLVTLSLIHSLLTDRSGEPIRIWCDKHGGRNRYAAMLQHFFPDDFVRVHCETRAESHYSWNMAGQPADIRFTAKGERQLACAAASMTSKYLRELAMRAFNQFWCGQVPGLRPTAGYPADARRFRAQIRRQQERLGIQDSLLWRAR